VSTTTIEPAAAPLQFTAWERPGRGWDEPGLRPTLLPPSQRPGRMASGRMALGRFWRFLTEPRAGIRHADFFAPYGRPRADRPRPFC